MTRELARVVHTLAAIAVFGAVVLGVLLFVASKRPLPLGPLAETVLEARLGARLANAGLRAETGALDVTLLAGLVPVVSARDVELHRDGEDTPLVSLASAEIVLHRDSLLLGNVSPRAVRLDGLSLSLVKRAEAVDLDLGRARFLEAIRSPGELLAELDAMLSRPALARLDTLGLTGIELRAEDRANGWVWHSRAGTLRLTRESGRIALDMALSDLGPVGGPGTVLMSFTAEPAAGTGSARIAARGLNPVQLLPAEGAVPDLAGFGTLDAPLSVALSARLLPGGELAPLEGTLGMGEGAWDSPAGQRVTLDTLSAQLRFDPEADRLSVRDLRFSSDLLSFHGDAQVLGQRDGNRALTALAAQVSLADVSSAPGLGLDGGLKAPVVEGVLSYKIATGALRFGPIDVALPDTRLQAHGVVKPPLGAQQSPARVEPIALTDEEMRPVKRLLPEGWSMALDLSTPEIAARQAVALWPLGVSQGTRNWATKGVRDGIARDARLSLRLAETGRPEVALSFHFSGGAVAIDPGLPEVSGGAGFFSLQDRTLAVEIAEAEMEVPDGGTVRISDALVSKPDTRLRNDPLNVSGHAHATATTALAFLEQPFFARKDGAPEASSPIAPEDVDGTVALAVALSVPVGPDRESRRAEYAVDGMLDVETGALLPGRALAGEGLRISLRTGSVRLEGPVTIDGDAADVVWTRALGPGADPGSRLEIRAPLTRSLAAGFGAPLQAGDMQGAGQLEATVDLAPGTAPRLALSADLSGAAMRLAGLGWSKPEGTRGRFELDGRLGAAPEFDRFVLDAPGLSLRGRLSIASGGGMDRLNLSAARIGGWFDGQAELRPAGAGRVALTLGGGTLDLQDLPKGGGGGPGAVGPVAVSLDRVRVSDTLALTDVRGEVSLASGVSGDLTGRVNGGKRVSVRLRPDSGGPNIRIRSDDAGRVARDAGIYRNAHGGALDLRLTPAGGGAGRYVGRLEIDDTVIRNAPVAANVLSAISLVGLAEQAGTGGLAFGEVDAEFLLTPGALVISKASATGPSLGLSLDGRMNLRAGTFDMQGVISPFYFVNRVGAGMTRRGEGLFGVTFRLDGPFEKPQVRANPLSLLTPGMFREIFRRAPPRLSGGSVE